MSGTTILHSLNDRKVGVTRLGNLAGNDIQITRPCVDATVTVAAENANVRAITIALKDIFGAAINYVEMVDIIVFGAADMLSFASTGGSTGIAIGTNGALLTIVAKKLFRATSEADGTIDLTWTDTGTESVAVGVRLPNGRVVVSSAFANT